MEFHDQKTKKKYSKYSNGANEMKQYALVFTRHYMAACLQREKRKTRNEKKRKEIKWNEIQCFDVFSESLSNRMQPYL